MGRTSPGAALLDSRDSGAGIYGQQPLKATYPSVGPLPINRQS